MKAVIKPLALFGLAGVVSVGGWWLIGSANGDGPTASLIESPARSFGFGTRRYELRDLDLARATLNEVDESYVDPHRIDPERMFEAALDAIERRVPAALLRRTEDGRHVQIQMGEHRQVVDVGDVTTPEQLLVALQQVVGVVDEHLDPESVRVERGVDPRAAIEYSLINGILGTLDPHSRLLPPDDSREMDVENKGEFGGLGVTIVERDGQLTIDYPLPDTPAADAGLVANDRIVRIDGESTINMDLQEAVERLRGRVGSEVVLGVERDGEPEPFEVRIVRQTIKMNPVEGELLDGGIGLVSIKSFHANVAADLEETLTRLAREVPGGVLRGLVLDLRDNPGGYLHQAEQVADLFLEDGEIVSTQNRSTVEPAKTARAARTQPRYPIVVLVSPSSASASEIVAGALQKNFRAVIVGERSFGKGSVQNLKQMPDDSKLKLTIAKYFLRGGSSIQSVGIPADVRLVSSIVRKGEEGGHDTIRLYGSERVKREADFDNHLGRVPEMDVPPSYTLRYLRPADLRRRGPSLDHLRADPEVRFARDALIASAGLTSRPEILANVHTVVSTYRERGQREVAEALGEVGIDWTVGPSLEGAQLDVALDLGEDGQLVAGQTETIWLEVTNRGPQTIHQLAAVSTSDTEILDGHEFFFGRLDPGQTLRYAQHVTLNEGYPSERTPVTVTFRDGGNDALAAWSAQLPVQGRPRPRLAWQWRLEDTAKGNGDGVAQVGEILDLIVTVDNVGEGPTAEAFARVKNRSRRAIDLRRGTVEPGTVRDADGEPCVALVGGMEAGNEVEGLESAAEETARRVVHGEAPTWPAECHRTLLPGESWTGRFEVEISALADRWEVDLELGDASAYDYASVMRAGFYDTFTNSDTISFAPVEPLPLAGPRVPPRIEVTSAPAAASDVARVELSGVVTDDEGVAYVTVWRGTDKVGLIDGGGLSSVSLQQEIELEPGLNTLAIVATDGQGNHTTSSVVTVFTPAEVHARADSPELPVVP